MDYHFLARESSHESWCGDGEVQIFGDYRQRLTASRIARAEVLAEPDAPRHPQALRERVWVRREEVLARRQRATR